MSRFRRATRGQALVEFAIALPVFLVILMGIFDLGRGIYQYNGVSEAAREIARVTSVHPGSVLGASTETTAVINSQKQLVPELASPTFQCYQDAAATVPKVGLCMTGDFVRVVAYAPYRAVSPLLALINSTHAPCSGTNFACLQAVSTVKIQ